VKAEGRFILNISQGMHGCRPTPRPSSTAIGKPINIFLMEKKYLKAKECWTANSKSCLSLCNMGALLTRKEGG